MLEQNWLRHPSKARVKFMYKKIACLILLILLVFSAGVFAQKKTVVKSNYAKRKLIGRHMLSLQWISWKQFGRAYVKQRKGVLYLSGKQQLKGSKDYLRINGVITEVNRYNFKFNGKITIRVSHNNGGEPCVREGDMTFAIRKKRKYWRLQEMRNPCEEIVDYVDIYFR